MHAASISTSAKQRSGVSRYVYPFFSICLSLCNRCANGQQKGRSNLQTPLLRFAADLLYNKLDTTNLQQIEVMKFERNVVPASSAPTRPVYVTAPFIRRPSELLLFCEKKHRLSRLIYATSHCTEHETASVP